MLPGKAGRETWRISHRFLSFFACCVCNLSALRPQSPILRAVVQGKFAVPVVEMESLGAQEVRGLAQGQTPVSTILGFQCRSLC